MIVDELVTLLGLEESPGSKKTAQNFKKGLEEVKKAAIAGGLALAAASAAFGVFTKRLAENVDEAGKFARSVGIGFEELQELEFAIGRTGGKAESLRGDIQKLTQSMTSPIPGEFNRELLLLGINTRDSAGHLRSATDILGDLSQRFEGLSVQEAQQFGAKLGLTQDTIVLLQQGKAGIEKLRAEARKLGGILPEEAVKIAEDFKDRLHDLNFVFDGLVNQIGIAVMPAMTDVIKGMTDFFVANRQVIQSGLESFIRGIILGFRSFADVVGKVGDYISEMIALLPNLGDGLNGVEIAASAVFTILSALTVVAGVFLAKFLLIGAAVTAVVVLIDDLITSLSGGEGVFKKIGEAIANTFPNAIGLLKDFFGFFATFAERFPGLTGLIVKAIEYIGEVFSFVFDVIGQRLELYAKRIDFVFGLFGKIGSFIGAGLDALEGLVSDGDGAGANVSANVLRNVQAVSQGAGTTQANIPASIINNTSSARGGDVTNTIVVNGAGDPRSVANEVVRRGGLQDVQQQLAPGIGAAVMG